MHTRLNLALFFIGLNNSLLLSMQPSIEKESSIQTIESPLIYIKLYDVITKNTKELQSIIRMNVNGTKPIKSEKNSEYRIYRDFWYHEITHHEPQYVTLSGLFEPLEQTIPQAWLTNPSAYSKPRLTERMHHYMQGCLVTRNMTDELYHIINMLWQQFIFRDNPCLSNQARSWAAQQVRKLYESKTLTDFKTQWDIYLELNTIKIALHNLERSATGQLTE